MGLTDKVYEWLASGPTPGCERVLGDALARAEPAYVERLGECLLRRRTAAAWNGLISSFAVLPEDMRTRVTSEPDLMMAGITSAIKSEASEARMNALEAYALFPTERLSHILPVVLRDASLPIRSRAAQVLRAVADAVYTRREATWEDPDTDDRDTRQSVRKLVDTLREVIRGMDIHCRVETVEVCLWFCQELDTDLWQAINKSRSRVAHVIEERLGEWDGPRIAPFLLRAAALPAWRRGALKQLGEWQSDDRLTALLRYTAMLGDPAVRRAMQSVKRPPWFSTAGWELLSVPEELRPYAPNWVCAGGFSDRERIAYLTRWARGTGTKLGQAAARALGKLGHADGQRETGGGARGRPGTSTWSHAGGAEYDQPNSAPPPPKRDPTSDSSRNTEFSMLWQLCRRTPPGDNGELVALLLEHIGVWIHRLADCARSPDPRDRILAMQIIRAGGLNKSFRFELEALERDKIEGIRKLAAAMLDTSAGTAAAENPATQPSPAQPVAPSVEPTQEARDTLKTILSELIQRDDIRAEESVMLLDELKNRLRQLYGQERSESSEEPTAGQVSA